jgi:hypothetical protein
VEEEVVPLVLSEEASEMSMGVASVVAPSARRRREVSCISMGINGSGVWDFGCVSWGKFRWNKEENESLAFRWCKEWIDR